MIIIAGGGLAGLSTSLFLRREHKILEKEDEAGGLVRSFHQEGFSFDCAGHWFHARLGWVKDLMSKQLGKNWIRYQRDARIWSKGVFTHYPFQTNLGGLPREVIIECIMGLIKAKHMPENGAVRTFEDYILRTMGEGVARHFMVPYNRKLWHLHPKEMTTAWLGRFVPEPDIEEALRSALEPNVTAFRGYNAGFHYPKEGGAAELYHALLSEVQPVECKAEICRINVRKRRVRLADGRSFSYDSMVNTMPLHRFMEITEDAPPGVRKAARALNWVSIAVLNIGVTDYRNPAHWFYVPEKLPAFFRVGCYSNVCPSMAPNGCASLYLEFSFLRKIPRNYPKLTGAYALEWLKRIGAVGAKGRLVTEMCLPIKYGYVLYDHSHRDAVTTIQRYLRKHCIYSIGRYGAWEYSSMEDAMEQGRRTAEILNHL